MLNGFLKNIKMREEIQWDFIYRIFHNIALITFCVIVIIMGYITWWAFSKFKNKNYDTDEKRKNSY